MLLMYVFALLLSFSSMGFEADKRIPEQVPTQPDASCTSPAELMDDAQGSSDAGETERAIIDEVAGLVGQTEHDAVVLATALSKEIAAGVLEVETYGRRIVLRVKEHGSFASGSASLTSDFKPVLRVVRDVLQDTTGQIFVEGHTDDVPIATSRFHSNLELSSSRAISVAHGLFEDGTMDPRRFTVTGYADSRPLESNGTEEGRSRNRRVEVVIEQGFGDVKDELEALRESDPEAFDRVRTELIRRFNLKPDEAY